MLIGIWIILSLILLCTIYLVLKKFGASKEHRRKVTTNIIFSLVFSAIVSFIFTVTLLPYLMELLSHEPVNWVDATLKFQEDISNNSGYGWVVIFYLVVYIANWYAWLIPSIVLGFIMAYYNKQNKKLIWLLGLILLLLLGTISEVYIMKHNFERNERISEEMKNRESDIRKKVESDWDIDLNELSYGFNEDGNLTMFKYTLEIDSSYEEINIWVDKNNNIIKSEPDKEKVIERYNRLMGEKNVVENKENEKNEYIEKEKIRKDNLKYSGLTYEELEEKHGSGDVERSWYPVEKELISLNIDYMIGESYNIQGFDSYETSQYGILFGASIDFSSLGNGEEVKNKIMEAIDLLDTLGINAFDGYVFVDKNKEYIPVSVCNINKKEKFEFIEGNLIIDKLVDGNYLDYKHPCSSKMF